jgi:uncharacterized protein
LALTVAIVDASALIAAADLDEPAHGACAAVLRRSDLVFVVPALIVAEAAYIVGRRLGFEAEARFIAGLRRFDLMAPNPEELPRMAELIRGYANFPLGAADASVIALAERYRTDTIVTLDRRHFGAVKPAHAPSLRLLPE